MHDSMHKGGVNNWTAADCAGWTLANGGFGDLLATPGGAGRSDSPAGDSVGPFGGLGDQADQGRPFSQVLVADELAAPADEDGRTAGQTCSLLLAAVGRGAPQPEAVRRNAGADLGATCAGRLAPTARTRQLTRVAEGRRGRGFAKKPSAFAETAQSGSIRRPEQQREESKRGSSAKTVVWRPVDRLPCSCQDGQKGNPG